MYWILDNNRRPIRVRDMLEWASWMEANGEFGRRVAFDNIRGVDISTVFLGIDHNHTGNGPPILFETMVFGGEYDGHQERCSTWWEAEVQHKAVCNLVRKLRIVSWS